MDLIFFIIQCQQTTCRRCSVITAGVVLKYSVCGGVVLYTFTGGMFAHSIVFFFLVGFAVGSAKDRQTDTVASGGREKKEDQVLVDNLKHIFVLTIKNVWHGSDGGEWKSMDKSLCQTKSLFVVGHILLRGV